MISLLNYLITKMYINAQGQIVIEDAYICDFMSKNGSEEFMNLCESLVKQVCLACSTNLKKDASQVDELMTRLNIFKGELIDTMSSKILDKKVDLTDMTKRIDEFEENHRRMTDELKTKIDTHEAIREVKIESIKEKIDFGGIMTTHTVLDNKLSIVQHTLNGITSKIDKQETLKNTNRFKGEEGEKGLFAVLEDILSSRDGYSIHDTKAIAHNCDINIKRTGYPDIRIESKAHGQFTKEPVRTSEVKRFESDITGLNCHGIFVSLYSGICGKKQIEIDLLPNNKFAVYLSNNNYDCEIIKDHINLIYKLDSIISSATSDDTFRINTESMAVLRNYLNDFNTKINVLKINMKNSINILNEMSIDHIERIICGNVEVASSKKVECEWCKKEFETARSLPNHKRYCPKNPSKTSVTT